MPADAIASIFGTGIVHENLAVIGSEPYHHRRTPGRGGARLGLAAGGPALNEREAALRRAVGARLRSLRQGLGWTLDDLVRRSAKDGVRLSRSTLHRMELGSSVLPFDTVAVVAHAMGTSLVQLEAVIRAACAGTARDAEGLTLAEIIQSAASHGAAGRIDHALALYEVAYERLIRGESTPSPDSLERVLLHLADCSRRLRQFVPSRDYAGRLLNLPGISPDTQTQALLIEVSIGYMTDDFYRAELFCQRALERLDQVSPRTRAYASAVIGNLFYKQRNFRPAVQHLTAGAAGYEQLEEWHQAAHVLATLGHAQFGSMLKRQARDTTRRGLCIARERGFLETVVYAHRLLALMDAEDGYLESASAEFEEGLKVARRLHLVHQQFLCWHGIWTVARRCSDVAREKQARDVLRRLLFKLDASLPEAEQFSQEVAVAADRHGRLEP